MSNSLRPHGPQPTRLLCPWDFPGKSTGVGCHHLLRYKIQLEHSKNAICKPVMSQRNRRIMQHLCYLIAVHAYIHSTSHYLLGQFSSVAQLCPTLCDPIDCSLPGSSVHGIFQAIVLEWIAISFSSGSSWPRDWTQVSRIADRRFTVWATREVCAR